MKIAPYIYLTISSNLMFSLLLVLNGKYASSELSTTRVM
nr:MAG TPA: hypothetical protein [Caudoviricetes sp.]